MTLLLDDKRLYRVFRDNYGLCILIRICPICFSNHYFGESNLVCQYCRRKNKKT